jgi:tRNA acetyltransferase TAN1
VPRKNGSMPAQATTIQPGDSGIWATCSKGRESKCIGELRDLFNEYAELLYGETLAASGASADDAGDGTANDIESSIQAEVAGIQKPATVQLFTSVRIDVQCGKQP